MTWPLTYFVVMCDKDNRAWPLVDPDGFALLFQWPDTAEEAAQTRLKNGHYDSYSICQWPFPQKGE